MGIDKAPSPCDRQGAAHVVYALDAHGLRTSVKNFDGDGNPAADPSCMAFESRLAHDALGRLTERSYWNHAGAPIDCQSTGFHRRASAYDQAGREVESRYFGTAGEPVSNLGTWVQKVRYDNYDHVTETRTHDADGVLVNGELGAAVARFLYDDGHRLFAKLLFDVDGAPANFSGCSVGHACPDAAWHAVRVVRDETGKVIANEFFDAQRQLMTSLDCAVARCWLCLGRTPAVPKQNTSTRWDAGCHGRDAVH